MEPLHHRQPGPVAASLDALARGATHVELIADGVHLADETVHLVFAVDRGRHVVLAADQEIAFFIAHHAIGGS
jgi:N-acetylglucosamine-6-phosphate deacetylase